MLCVVFTKGVGSVVLDRVDRQVHYLRQQTQDLSYKSFRWCLWILCKCASWDILMLLYSGLRWNLDTSRGLGTRDRDAAAQYWGSPEGA